VTLTHTYTRTSNRVTFADPYKQCCKCNGWVTGSLVKPGPLVVLPCEHESDYRDVCPSWGPVNGCRCAEFPWGAGYHGVPPRPIDGQVL
jgi:hypothetical protein